MPVNPLRVQQLNQIPERQGPVIYWMSRDQRVSDNWALLYAQEVAIEREQPLVVIFCLVEQFLEACDAQFLFMLKGLEQVSASLKTKNIPFSLLQGDPTEVIPRFIQEVNAGLLVCDFDPLRMKHEWQNSVKDRLNVAMFLVDAHNIVPCWLASPKKEYAAYTFRPKIKRALPEFLTEFPQLIEHPFADSQMVPLTNGLTYRSDWLKVEHHSYKFKTVEPGERNALDHLQKFIKGKLERYATDQSDPTLQGQSSLSAYLHFGQIASQRVALEVGKSGSDQESVAAFLEQVIVRKELSDNFCYYEKQYDRIEAAPNWSLQSIQAHRTDPRDYQYKLAVFEMAETHDPLWNAAQMEMVKTGCMHGYLRMYWAKKILEWTHAPEEALAVAIYLNDKYQLDGRDPNGYAGIAWSIAGVHDRAWAERPIFGKIRFMSYNGCKSKFKVQEYIDRIERI